MPFSPQQIADETRRYFQKVYGWMCLGLFISGAIAYYISFNIETFHFIFDHKIIFFGLLILELVLVFGLALQINRISAWLAVVLFLVYCAVTGVTLSVIFLIYTIQSIGLTFFVTAGMFAAMSAYGFFTKTDLSGIGQVLIMGLFGIILGSLVNLFLKNSAVDFIITIIGVVIFSGLTAYDTQKIRKINIIGNEGTEADLKESIIGALELYLDFVNLFLYLLRLFGKRK